MTPRRLAALRARAAHPATPEAEAAVCRELLARLVVPAESGCGCRFCTAVSTDPVAAARWEAIQDYPRTRVLVCGVWVTTTT